jgi:hypothetical protein
MNVWQWQERISKRLMMWAGVSMVVGLLLRRGGKFWRGVGEQFMGWGLVNALIAFFGQSAAWSKVDSYDNPGETQVLREERDNLSKLLWLNAGLDVLYMLGGRAFARRDKGDGKRRGVGLGIVLQALFLLVFDVLHAKEVEQAKVE